MLRAGAADLAAGRHCPPPALKLPHGDQFDLITTATTKLHRLTLLTEHANIADAGIVTTVW